MSSQGFKRTVKINLSPGSQAGGCLGGVGGGLGQEKVGGHLGGWQYSPLVLSWCCSHRCAINTLWKFTELDTQFYAFISIIAL